MSTGCRIRAFPDAGHSNPPERRDYTSYTPTFTTYTLPAGTTTGTASGPSDTATMIDAIEAELIAREMYVAPPEE